MIYVFKDMYVYVCIENNDTIVCEFKRFFASKAVGYWELNWRTSASEAKIFMKLACTTAQNQSLRKRDSLGLKNKEKAKMIKKKNKRKSLCDRERECERFSKWKKGWEGKTNNYTLLFRLRWKGRYNRTQCAVEEK